MAAYLHQKCGFQHYLLDHCSFLLVFCKLFFFFGSRVEYYCRSLYYVASAGMDGRLMLGFNGSCPSSVQLFSRSVGIQFIYDSIFEQQANLVNFLPRPVDSLVRIYYFWTALVAHQFPFLLLLQPSCPALFGWFLHLRSERNFRCWSKSPSYRYFCVI